MSTNCDTGLLHDLLPTVSCNGRAALLLLALLVLVVLALLIITRTRFRCCGAGDANGFVPRAIAAVRSCIKREGKLISPAERYRGSGRHSSYRRLQEGRESGSNSPPGSRSPKKRKVAPEDEPGTALSLSAAISNKFGDDKRTRQHIRPEVPRLRGQLVVRPGMLADRRADGTATGLSIVVASVDEARRDCDLSLFAKEEEAKLAVQHIGLELGFTAHISGSGSGSGGGSGWLMVAKPTPTKVLRHVKQNEVSQLTDGWTAPPWEELTYRNLSPGRLSPGRTSPVPANQDSWRLWLEAHRAKRQGRPVWWPRLRISKTPPKMSPQDESRMPISGARPSSPPGDRSANGRRGVVGAAAEQFMRLTGRGSATTPSRSPKRSPKKSPKDKAKAEAARRAKAEAKRKAEEEERRRRQEYILVLSGISASGVPEADARNGSDPYVCFELLGCDGLERPPKAQTPQLMNTTEPSWDRPVRLMLPAGSPPAMEQKCSVRVSILDKDLTDEDDLLGQCEARIEQPTGAFDALTLSGVGGFADCTVRFSYEIQPFEPPPPATLLLDAVEAFDLCDDLLAAGDNGEPLATSDIRLEGSSGTMEATLPGRIGYKDVRLRFAYSTAEVA